MSFQWHVYSLISLLSDWTYDYEFICLVLNFWCALIFWATSFLRWWLRFSLGVPVLLSGGQSLNSPAVNEHEAREDGRMASNRRAHLLKRSEDSEERHCSHTDYAVQWLTSLQFQGLFFSRGVGLNLIETWFSYGFFSLSTPLSLSRSLSLSLSLPFPSPIPSLSFCLLSLSPLPLKSKQNIRSLSGPNK